jgi:hypothetical protein
LPTDGLGKGTSSDVRTFSTLPHTDNTTGFQHAVGFSQRPQWIIEVSQNSVKERGINGLVWKWQLVDIGDFKPQVCVALFLCTPTGQIDIARRYFDPGHLAWRDGLC